jgi:hypothetical protein
MRLRGERKHEFRLGESVELVPHEAEHEAICEMVALRAQGALRAIATAMAAKEGAIGSAMRAQRRPEGSRHLRGGRSGQWRGRAKAKSLVAHCPSSFFAFARAFWRAGRHISGRSAQLWILPTR